jgi:integrase
MTRIQKGHIYEASGAFYVRYWATEIVDGRLKRVQRSERLSFKDDKHYAVNAKAVKLLRDRFMLTVNSQNPSRVNQKDIAIADFWERTYLPFVESNLRPSTVAGYQQIWNQHLRLHFAQRTLREYRTHMGSQFLTGLTKTQGRRTLAHIRSLASGIFSHAANIGLLETNPWHDVKILGKVEGPSSTPFYTIEEIEDIISALADHTDCQLIMALAFFLGLRPGEIAGLKWQDFDAKWVHIRRAVVRGDVGETKTPESVASLPLIAPVQVPLRLWRKQCGNPSEGWIFQNKFGRPADLRELVRRIIVPVLTAKKILWKGLYAGRRGAGTALTELTGSAIAAQQILRHKNLAVTTGFYVKEMPAVGLNGMRLLEAAAKNREK